MFCFQALLGGWYPVYKNCIQHNFFVFNIYNKTTLSLRMFYQHIYINISTTHVMSLELGEIPKTPKWIEMNVYSGNLANVVSETYYTKVCTQTKMGFETD